MTKTFSKTTLLIGLPLAAFLIIRSVRSKEKQDWANIVEYINGVITPIADKDSGWGSVEGKYGRLITNRGYITWDNTIDNKMPKVNPGEIWRFSGSTKVISGESVPYHNIRWIMGDGSFYVPSGYYNYANTYSVELVVPDGAVCFRVHRRVDMSQGTVFFSDDKWEKI